MLFGPNKDFTGKTQGLCGMMDDDASNDFQGPNGTLYEDAVEFAETCNITSVITRILESKRLICN